MAQKLRPSPLPNPKPFLICSDRLQAVTPLSSQYAAPLSARSKVLEGAPTLSRFWKGWAILLFFLGVAWIFGEGLFGSAAARRRFYGRAERCPLNLRLGARRLCLRSGRFQVVTPSRRVPRVEPSFVPQCRPHFKKCVCRAAGAVFFKRL